MKRRSESSVTTVELGMGARKRPTRREKPMSTSERVDALPKVSLKRRVVRKPLPTQDLELKADNIILE
jgi:hypothetical protein